MNWEVVIAIYFVIPIIAVLISGRQLTIKGWLVFLFLWPIGWLIFPPEELP